MARKMAFQMLYSAGILMMVFLLNGAELGGESCTNEVSYSSCQAKQSLHGAMCTVEKWRRKCCEYCFNRATVNIFTPTKGSASTPATVKGILPTRPTSRARCSNLFALAACEARFDKDSDMCNNPPWFAVCCNYCVTKQATQTTSTCLDLLESAICNAIVLSGNCNTSLGLQCCKTCSSHITSTTSATTSTTETSTTTTLARTKTSTLLTSGKNSKTQKDSKIHPKKMTAAGCVDTGDVNCASLDLFGVNPCIGVFTISCCGYCLTRITKTSKPTPPPCYGDRIGYQFCDARNGTNPGFCNDYSNSYSIYCCAFCGRNVLQEHKEVAPVIGCFHDIK